MSDFPDASPFFTADEIEQCRARNPDFTPARLAGILARRRREAAQLARMASYPARRRAERKARERAERIARGKARSRKRKKV